MDILVDFEPMYPGFEFWESHDFFYYFVIIFFMFFLSLLLQCKFANSTLLSPLRFSYFIIPYDAQASSAFSALIMISAGAKIYRNGPNYRNGFLLFLLPAQFSVISIQYTYAE